MELTDLANKPRPQGESQGIYAKLSSTGITPVPQPSDDVKDPLNWSSLKKSTTLFIWCIGCFVTTASGLGNALGYFVQAKIYRKSDPITLSYSVVAATADTQEGLVRNLIGLVKERHDDFAMHLAFIAHIQDFLNDATLAEKGARRGLHRLTEVTCRRFVVQCQQTGIKRDRSGAETSSTECLSSPEDVALLLYQLCDTGKWDLHDLLLNRLLTSAETVHTFAFPAFYLPLLGTLVVRFQSCPDDVSCYVDLFKTVLENYRQRYIQPKPPGSDWAYSPEGCGDRYCYDCRKLDEFLVDPVEEIERFPVDNRRRAHLHQQLHRTSHSHDTDRSTYPETLVVKKKQSTSQKKLPEWQARVAEAEKALGAMDRDILKELLQEEYSEILDFEKVEKTHKTLGVRQSIKDSTGREAVTID